MQQQTKAILFQPMAGAPEAGGAPFGPVPGPEELAHIHRFTLEPLPAEQFYVRREGRDEPARFAEIEQAPGGTGERARGARCARPAVGRRASPP